MDHNRKNDLLLSTFDCLTRHVFSACGDGDGLLICRSLYHPLDETVNLFEKYIQEYNLITYFPIIEKHTNHTLFSDGSNQNINIVNEDFANNNSDKFYDIVIKI